MKLLLLLIAAHQICAAEIGPQLDDKAFASGINKFSDEYIKQLEYKDKNLIFSPLGLVIALGMVLKGAQGKPSDDIYKMINFGEMANRENIHNIFKKLMVEYKDMATRNSDTRNASLELANMVLWSESETLPSEYTDKLKADYEATVGQENFKTNGVAVKEKINKFVKERTHDLIPELLKEPLSPQTVFVLMNTIYFKGFWQLPFNPAITHKKVFYKNDKTEKEVDFMTRKPAHFNYYHCNVHNVAVVELKYKGDFSMFVMLPDEKYGLEKLIETLPKDKLSDFISQMNDSLVQVFLPKFKIGYQSNLLSILPKLGADITHALKSVSPTLLITDAIQQAVIKVHEGGTEAAAVTVISGSRTGVHHKQPIITFNADHPFAYCIRDTRRNLNLFCGLVNTLE